MTPSTVGTRPPSTWRIAQCDPEAKDLLRLAVAAVRQRFGGRVTYAAIPFEVTDWTPFDIVSVELIRSAAVAGQLSPARNWLKI